MSFRRAIEAYAGAPGDEDDGDPFQRREYVVPKVWTPYHVAKRLVVAYDIVEATTSTPGPAAYGNGWPAILREFEDLVDSDAMRHHKVDFEKSILRRRLRPTPMEIDMAEESIGWLAEHLTPGSQEIDALSLWTLATAKGLDVSRLLHRRRLMADAMIEAIRPNQIGLTVMKKGRLEAAVAGVLFTANRMLEEARQAARDARSDRGSKDAREAAAFARKFALARLRTQVRLEALVTRPAQKRIRRTDVIPGKVFSQSVYDERRKLGAQIVADSLDARGVSVR
jgi:hypothetical protein